MTNDDVDHLDDILINWFSWTIGWRPAIGYPTRAIFDKYSYNSATTEAGEEIDARQAEAVDAIINELPVEQRRVLSICVRNKYNKVAVFRSTRYTLEEMQAIFWTAKEALFEKLTIRGIM